VGNRTCTYLVHAIVLIPTDRVQCYSSSWNYASTFTSNLAQPFLPNYSASSDSHIAALHQSIIPNWTSPAFTKFVDAIRAVVDELANAQTSGNGREEMTRCESAWMQVLWLWERSWPDVDGMGEEDESATVERLSGNGIRASASAAAPSASATGNGATVVIDDGDDDSDGVAQVRRPSGSYDSPYGGSGLQAVEAANAV